VADYPRYIPDTTYVRNAYMLYAVKTPTVDQDEAYAEFDAWLKRHDEMVRHDAAIRAEEWQTEKYGLVLPDVSEALDWICVLDSNDEGEQ